MQEGLELEVQEARVFGVLIEKSLATPEHYPLSLNSLTNGCNQKSNREPHMDLSTMAVGMLIDKLVIRGLVGRVQAAGSRVEHYRHNGGEMLDCQEPQLAILAELLLRGPQSFKALRKRSERMSPMETEAVFSSHLEQLLRRGLLKRLPAGMGSRTERVAQTLAPDAAAAESTSPPLAAAPTASSPPQAPDDQGLEARVERLESQLAQLALELGVTLEESESDLA
ncbi:MAG: DUF480 domain-containing protein [bacterium]|nr:DUF480 domain-containing protein [Planctomycetota bacterium]HIL52713.1 DUF480 domain-containing protein [Planctomycetota bacterium]